IWWVGGGRAGRPPRGAGAPNPAGAGDGELGWRGGQRKNHPVAPLLHVPRYRGRRECPPTLKMGMKMTLTMGMRKRTCPAEHSLADAQVVAVVPTTMTPQPVPRPGLARWLRFGHPRGLRARSGT